MVRPQHQPATQTVTSKHHEETDGKPQYVGDALLYCQYQNLMCKRKESNYNTYHITIKDLFLDLLSYIHAKGNMPRFITSQ